MDTAHRREDAVAQDGADTQHHQHPQHILGLAGLDEALPPVSRLDALRPVLGAAASSLGALPPQLRIQRKGTTWCSDGMASVDAMGERLRQRLYDSGSGSQL